MAIADHREPALARRLLLGLLEPLTVALLADPGRNHGQDVRAEHPQLGGVADLGVLHEALLGLLEQRRPEIGRQVLESPDDHLRLLGQHSRRAQRLTHPPPSRPEREAELDLADRGPSGRHRPPHAGRGRTAGVLDVDLSAVGGQGQLESSDLRSQSRDLAQCLPGLVVAETEHRGLE